MISIEFKQNIEFGDLVTVRSTLVDYLIINRSFRSFNEALNYARASLDIVQPYDNIPFEVEPEKWNSEYLNQQKVALMVNFSEERIDHIKKVIEKVLLANDVQQSEVPSTRPVGKVSQESRTGKTVLSEKAVQPRTSYSEKINPSQQESHNPEPSSGTSRSNKRSTTGRSGTREVRETCTTTKRSENGSRSEADGIGTAMIVGGVAVAAVGLVTVEPVVVGTGIVIAGAGVGVKAKNRR